MAIERQIPKEPLTTPEVRIHDWDQEGSEIVTSSNFKLLCTTLRDGQQMPGITQPTLQEKRQIIDFDARLGIHAIDICMPVSRGRYYKEGIECAKYIKENYPEIEVVVLTRTMETDVQRTIDFSNRAGFPLSVILFRGSSDLRLLAEDWDEGRIVDEMFRYSTELVKNGQKVICATEDTTRTRPDFLKKIYSAGLDGGASELCVADTAGYADPIGIKKQLEWVKAEIIGPRNIPIHFHGHEDTRNSVANSIAAIKTVPGVVIHATWLGIGERAGNMPLESFLSDLRRRGDRRFDMTEMLSATDLVSKATGVPIPKNHPLVGEIINETASGIHTAAIVKALEKGLEDEAGIVYSAVSPREVGRELEFKIGFLSGYHNVAINIKRINEERGLNIECSDELANALINYAGIRNSELDDEEIIRIATNMNENGNNGVTIK